MNLHCNPIFAVVVAVALASIRPTKGSWELVRSVRAPSSVEPCILEAVAWDWMRNRLEALVA